MATNFGSGAILSRIRPELDISEGILSMKVILTGVAPMLFACSITAAQTTSVPSPPGRMVNIDGRIDGRKLHLNCSGRVVQRLC